MLWMRGGYDGDEGFLRKEGISYVSSLVTHKPWHLVGGRGSLERWWGDIQGEVVGGTPPTPFWRFSRRLKLFFGRGFISDLIIQHFHNNFYCR